MNEHISNHVSNKESNILRQRREAVVESLDDYLSRNHHRHSLVLLDVGCGQGSYFEDYKRRGLSVICIEIDRNTIRSAMFRAKSLGLKAEFVVADAHFIPLCQNIADITIFSQVLEHLNSPLKAIREAKHVSKRGSLLLVDIPYLWQFYRLPSGLALRSLTCLKFFGKPNIVLKLLYRNASQISSMKESGEIQRRIILGSILSVLEKASSSLEIDSFIFDYCKGNLRNNIHKNWFYPTEWTHMIKKLGFTKLKVSGSFVVPPIIGFSRHLSLPFLLIEKKLPHGIRRWLGQVAIICAIKE